MHERTTRAPTKTKQARRRELRGQEELDIDVKRGMGLVAYHERVTESNLGHLALVHLFFNGARSMDTKQKKGPVVTIGANMMEEV